MKFGNVLSIVALVAGVSATRVIEATDNDFESLLKPGLPTMLDIYASWCGHCKRLAPVYDELSDMFSPDQVQFIKIDGDIHRKTAKKYNVEYFPTLKFIKADQSIVDVDVRDLDGMSDFVKQHTGIGAKKAPVLPSAVVPLNDTNFDSFISGKNGFVTFTSEFCSHCKNMKPEFEKLAQLYVRDSDSLVVGNVDCSSGQPTTRVAEKFEITRYPTILFFPKDGSEPIAYSGSRSLEDFNEFLISKEAGFRTLQGSLNNVAGRIAELDVLASDASSQEVLSNLKKKATDLDAALYVRYADKVSTGGRGYVEKEIARLGKLISGSLGDAKKDELQIKLNILSAFKAKKDVSHEDL
jgi:protein disulfide-isomerase A6